MKSSAVVEPRANDSAGDGSSKISAWAKNLKLPPSLPQGSDLWKKLENKAKPGILQKKLRELVLLRMANMIVR
ncbi:hypothetical protein Leryth_020702 [Lithospermum erythrorhizon]|nr:hypothetical protein Leryth_020702 [Lithospermum erythrorhizon]